MSHDTHNIQKEVKGYMLVFFALGVGTVITVAISYLQLPIPVAILIALTVATVKAGLVACYFMHLISEQKLIYFILGFVVIFFFAMLFLPMAEFHNMYQGMKHVS